MKLNKEITRSIAAFSVLAVVTGCASGNSIPNVPANTNFNAHVNFNKSVSPVATITNAPVKIVKEAAGQHVYVDLGNGKKTGASITFKVNLGNPSGFSTKASSDGTVHTVNEVKSLQVYLLEFAPSALASASTGTNLSTSIATTRNSFSFNHSGPSIGSGTTDTATVTYTNVPFNSDANSGAAKAYYIGVSAFDDTDASGNNITNTNSSTTNYFKIGSEPIALSNGGNGNVSNIKVNSAYKVSSIADIGIGLKLLDGAGATIGATVDISNGSIPSLEGNGN